VENQSATAGPKPPRQVRARRLACKNAKFFLYFDHIVDRDGLGLKDFFVIAPKVADGNLVTGVAVLPVADGSVTLTGVKKLIQFE